MQPNDTPNRRAFLASAGIALTGILAGCTSGDNGGSGETAVTPSAMTMATPTPADTATPTATPSPTRTPTVKRVEMGPKEDCETECSRFKPEIIEIEAGTKVTWRNPELNSHTVTAYEDQLPGAAEYFASGGYESEEAAREAYWNGDTDGILEKGSPYSHVFDVSGEYRYFCLPHEDQPMRGTVKVL